MRHGRIRWFGHLEHKSIDDWVSACRRLVVEGARGRGRSRKTWEQCVKNDMKLELYWISGRISGIRYLVNLQSGSAR